MSCSANTKTVKTISSANLREVVEVLASDSLRGRLAGSGYDLKTAQYLEQKLVSYGYEPLFESGALVEFELPEKLSRAYKIYGDSITNKTYNVVMIKRAKNAKENVLIGAHYDHMGVAKIDSENQGFKKGDIFRGANDNATGVSTTLELARMFDENESKHNLVVALFGAEELGLLGSKALVEKFNADSIDIGYMINFEMTGTLRGDSVEVLGKDSHDMTKTFENVDSDGLIFVKNNSTFHGSDHIPFYKNNTPIVCFATMGVVYYHVPQDDLNSINWEGHEKVTNYVYRYFSKIMSQDKLPELM